MRIVCCYACICANAWRNAVDVKPTLKVINASTLKPEQGVTDGQTMQRIVGHATHAQEPEWFTTAPVGATQKLLAKTGWKVSDVDLWEVNEAFAVVPMALMAELKQPSFNDFALILMTGAAAQIQQELDSRKLIVTPKINLDADVPRYVGRR